MTKQDEILNELYIESLTSVIEEHQLEGEVQVEFERLKHEAGIVTFEETKCVLSGNDD